MKLHELVRKLEADPPKGPNLELFERAACHIERGTPEEFSQMSYGGLILKDGQLCGTAGCIAFHALAVLGMEPTIVKNEYEFSSLQPYHWNIAEYGQIHDAAALALGLTPAQAAKLFLGDASGWPEPYRTRYRKEAMGIFRNPIAGQ